ncbi:hypothetical protein P167DRAFT_572968 [Morchella conica CCBAS932]|uniref:BTB domain-containing protein n=1 Tax=Morchella conica CCBAS932 TaxID=1392247 RepID=A0A3N4KU45_9PEZI|nr:hypothetical protein P167DRAFT_572968 [Morchella conica CCBAS932]
MAGTTINTNTANTRGLHTLVDGLTVMSPTSPLTSPSLSASSPSPPQVQPQIFNPPAASSIFNNPGASSLSGAGVEGANTSPTSNSNAPARLQSFPSRPLGYSGTAGRTAESNAVNALIAAGNHSSGSSNPAVKEVDDPTTPISSPTFDRAVPNTFSRLFATPTPQSSYATSSDSVKLEDFLYTRGFLEGACSDVSILAFGNTYNLHRLILDRSPFFSTCFNGGPWLESTQSEISLSPEISDPNITQHSFEMALARLYGHVDRTEEDQHALPLLAAASYLDLQDLAESCVTSLLRNLSTSNISQVIRFVTNSFYGPLTDRLLDSAKALLYRDGWEMSFEDWDGISGEVAADIIGYDGFYVPSEWLRYSFVKEMVDWRINHSYTYNRDVGGSNFGTPGMEYDEAERASMAEEDEADLKPLRDLLENGIYYVHMTFEELQKIGDDRDVLGRRTVSESTIKEALWQQMLLRQRVLNVGLGNPELGITETEMARQSTPSGKKSPLAERPTTPRVGEKMSQSGSDPSTPTRNKNDGSNTLTTQIGKSSRRKYYIPTEDTTTVIGDCPEQCLIVSNQGGPGPKRVARGADHLGVEGADTSAPIVQELRYSEFPPFRFSAEFRSVRSLKEKKRVYSKTVFYAGSHWNIYIQKVRSSKNVQLGVYLHRAKDRETAGGSSSHNRGADDTNQIINVEEQQRIGNSTLSSMADDIDVTVTTDGDLTTSTFASINPNSRPGANTSAQRSSLPANADSANTAVPALSYYVDARPMIQTYFKIFSPSRKGKVLSMFSSGPDSFNFSQSWGWKSSSLILEEGSGGPVGESAEKDSRLRFMVVLGNV